MNDVIRVVIGSLVGAVAMFAVGFLFWASPLGRLGYSTASDQQGAAVQLSLASNLPHTGYYVIPNPDSAGGNILYSKGPVAAVNYNTTGYSATAASAMVGGFVHEAIVSLMIGFSLFVVARRVTDFESRARLVVGLSAAATVMIVLSDPIWMHTDWRFAIYAVVADLAMLVASGLVIARWFLPRAA